ncbi:hypothetical protein HL658_19125 [Azospirillum sp. RWY-5-1]|uniref:Inner membrane protein n=1 Tax=Azospirillum oleiclasticum TaxID=2735135 RepID=A0ABX2TDK0_9PROT|nr:mitofilin family membrane protein [Azospirillum oleiclasticum]NYZ14666.1 hypothetical protein [Azospirillum oleiclasticum]NYZ22348.1 hypothetical protein [Azospirillum oleiclasticum]
MTPRPGSDTPDQDPNGQQGPNESAQTPGGTAVERIIERFGGIRPMAHKLDIPVTTVQGWKKRGAIPLNRHPDLRSAAVRHGIALDESELDAATPSEERPAGAATGVYDPVSELQPAAVEPTPGRAAVDGGSAAERVIEDEPVVASPPPPPPVDERRSGGSGFATVVSVLALIAAGAALTQPWWMPQTPPAPTVAPATVQALDQRLGQIDQRVQQLASRPAATGDAAAQLQPLADRIGALEQRVQQAAQAQPGQDQPAQAAVDLAPLESRLAALEQRPAPEAPAQPPEDPRVAGLADTLASVQKSVDGVQQRLQQVGGTAETAQRLAQEVDGLKQQLASLQKDLQARRDASTAAEALVLAAGQLRAALAGSQPFQSELQAVRQLGVNDTQVAQALDSIAPFAPKGVPTRPTLTDRFSTLASDIVRAANKGNGTNWLDQVGGTLSTLVTVRQQGAGVVGDSAQAIVARTEAALQEGNLAQAVKEASALQGPAAEAASGWLADAKARLAADEAARQIGARSIALLGASAGAQKGAAQ